ncbi:MAG: hypothetical protein ABGY10_01320 [bacterium]|jgi:hypothetical protein|nr:hypothetical protein [Candidatus Manganitrophaceae bacterium]
MLSKEERIFLVETEEIFKTEKGQRVLDYLKKVLHAEETLEPEEILNKDLEAAGRVERHHIDPIAFAKRQGSRAAYFKIEALVRQGKRVREDVTNE